MNDGWKIALRRIEEAKQTKRSILLLGGLGLTSIPESIAHLKNLSVLDLGDNQLTAQPAWLDHAEDLVYLDLSGNPGLEIPEEALDSLDQREILAYYFAQRAGARPLNEAKLILVGQGGVGKTSLVKALVTGKFNSREKTTEGIKISDWSCSAREEGKSNDSYLEFRRAGDDAFDASVLPDGSEPVSVGAESASRWLRPGAYILKPEWITSGIYALLHAFVKSKGLFTRAEAEKVLLAKKYSAEAAGFILGLMEQFELSFALGDKQNRILIPQLLDDQQPNQTREFKPAECLNFGYQYPIVPEGLLPRFIVRTHHLSEPATRWKSGVILRDQASGCQALVRADAAESQVRVHIDGPEASRPELLGIRFLCFDGARDGDQAQNGRRGRADRLRLA